MVYHFGVLDHDPDLLAEVNATLTALTKAVPKGAKVGRLSISKGGVSLGIVPDKPAVAPEPQWPVITQAKPTIVRARKVFKHDTGIKTAVVLPDQQIGYRDFDGVLDPFHDEDAMNVALQIASDVKPDKIVNLGDFLDLAAHGRFDQEPSFQRTTQAAIDRGHLHLAEQRAIATDAEIHLLAGNHDARITKHLMNNAAASFGLRKGCAPESWPVMTIPYLLRLDELGVTWHGGYPTGRVHINNRLICVHGEYIAPRPSAIAAKVWQADPLVSVIHGHTHHSYQEYRTLPVNGKPTLQMVGSPGCLCSVTGNVPAHNSGILDSGRPAPRVMNWQQGIFVVSYEDGDGWFSVENVVIHRGRALFRGKSYESTFSD